MSSTPFDIPALLKEVESNGKDLIGNETARQRCLAAARTLCYALERPREAVLRMHYAEPTHQAAIRVGLDLKLFEALRTGDGKPVHTSTLAERTHANPELLARILKHLAAMGSIYETDVDQFLPTPLSNTLTESKYADGFSVLQDVVDPPVYKLHDYLSKNQYKNPENPDDCPFQLAHDTKSHYFQWMHEHPKIWQQFCNHMTSSRDRFASWMEKTIYPFEESLVEGSSSAEDAIFFIDIGGGNGHDIQEVCRNYPHVDKRMMLQDQASVIQKLPDKLDPRIQTMPHDFFQEQPVKGARAYYMHRIMHDWPNSKCLEILTNLRSAMTKGYSSLLLYDMVIPDRGAQGTSTGLDLIMMSLFASCERTEKGWKDLLDTAGFRILKIWTIDPMSESLIEAEIA